MQIAHITKKRDNVGKGVTYTMEVEINATERNTTGVALAAYLILTPSTGLKQRIYITAGEFQALKAVFEPNGPTIPLANWGE